MANRRSRRSLTFTPKSDQFQISSTAHSMKNLAFHSLLRWKMNILSILTTSLMHFSVKVWGNILFELMRQRVSGSTPGKIETAQTLAPLSVESLRVDCQTVGQRSDSRPAFGRSASRSVGRPAFGRSASRSVGRPAFGRSASRSEGRSVHVYPDLLSQISLPVCM